MAYDTPSSGTENLPQTIIFESLFLPSDVADS